MTFAPRFSPDGNRVLLSMAQDGNTEIYSMDLRTRKTERLTNSPAIDTSPSFAPDGKQIVFNSDRGGTPAALRHELRTAAMCGASVSAPAATPRRCGRRAVT